WLRRSRQAGRESTVCGWGPEKTGTPGRKRRNAVPRDMFGDVVKPSIKVGSRSWYTVPLSIIVHTVVIGAVVIIPLRAADVLPTPPSMMAFVAAAPPPPPPPPRPPPALCGPPRSPRPRRR